MSKPTLEVQEFHKLFLNLDGSQKIEAVAFIHGLEEKHNETDSELAIRTTYSKNYFSRGWKMTKENYEKCEGCGLYKHVEYKEDGLYYCADCYEDALEYSSEEELDFDE